MHFSLCMNMRRKESNKNRYANLYIYRLHVMAGQDLIFDLKIILFINKAKSTKRTTL